MGCEPADTPARLAARVDRLFLPGFGDEEAGPKEHAEGFGAALELHDLSSGEERAFSESEREAGTRDGALGSGNGEACPRGSGEHWPAAGPRLPWRRAPAARRPPQLLGVPFLHAPGPATLGFSGPWIHPAL